MARHAKSTKVQRARGIIAGLKKHAHRFVNPGLESPEAVASRYQAHLDALDNVASRTGRGSRRSVKKCVWRWSSGN